MKYRHEWKYEINYGDFLILKTRLDAVMTRDIHAEGGTYQVRSLYFDNLSDKVLKEKINGVNQREKFRIRYYNGDTSLIRLEKKSKDNNLSRKESASLTLFEVEELLKGKTDWMLMREDNLIRELYAKMQCQYLRPRTIVDYLRIPYVFKPGNVRVTLDYDIRMGTDLAHFKEAGCVTIPVRDNPIILEVKWDEFLPAIIQDAVDLPARRAGAFSKYASCRQYG